MFRARFLYHLAKSNSKINCRFAHAKLTEQKISVNGVRLNTVQTGRGENAVLLLPGTLGTAWTDFRPQIEKLPELLPNHTIVAWDPPGYGKSIPPNRLLNEDALHNDARCAVNLMRALYWDKFSLLGWSAGGMTALIIAGKFPKYIDKLVIWGAGAYMNENEIELLQVLKDVNKWAPNTRQLFEEVYGKKRFAEMCAACIPAICSATKQKNGDVCRAEVQQVEAPTFILRGNKDPLISDEHVNYLMDRLPCSKYHEFPEGKHNIHLRYPDEFNRLVADFLREDSEPKCKS